MTQEVVIVRHGETEWSRAQRHTGRTDQPLTAAGREQAAELRRTLKEHTFAAVFSSPLQRALDTARLAGFETSVTVDPDLCEWDYGAYEGLTGMEIQAMRPGWVLWRDGCPGGESIAEVSARADRVVERLRQVGGDVLAFAHGHLLRIVTARWLEMGPHEGQRFFLSPASPCSLGYEHDWAALRNWNLPR